VGDGFVLSGSIAKSCPGSMNSMGSIAAKASRRKPPKRPPLTAGALWHSVSFRGLLYQALVIVLVVGAAVYMVTNAQVAMEKRGIATGFGFLTEEAGFPIGESLIKFSPADTYLRAYGVAILNTLKVSVLSVIAATLIGTVLGIARLSSNVLLSRLSSIYIELFRNTPQLVQIIFWYTLVTRLPAPRQAWNPVDSIFLSNRGLVMPWPAADGVFLWVLLALLVGCVAAYLLTRWVDSYRRRSGRRLPTLWLAVAPIVGMPVLAWMVGGAPTTWSMPAFKGFNFAGGLTLSPEFLALLLGLSLYIAAFIAEIVRAGIQSVSRGQIEAARAIGLKTGETYRKVILPQALRVIVPPATAQYVSLTKNSSLGVAIGYPELFNVTNTVVTLSGNTIEAIAIMMAVYLTIAFSIAILMNWYNKLIQIKER
jgi:general L-amino acid transport system permease protein